MKKRFSDEQIISILREAEAGVSECAGLICVGAAAITGKIVCVIRQIPAVRRRKRSPNPHMVLSPRRSPFPCAFPAICHPCRYAFRLNDLSLT